MGHGGPEDKEMNWTVAALLGTWILFLASFA